MDQEETDMKRMRSAEFKKARDNMRASLIECHDCTDYATELHHIIAVENGGTDDTSNLMPLCHSCHKEYTSEQTIERNSIFIECSLDDNKDVIGRMKGEGGGVNLTRKSGS